MIERARVKRAWEATLPKVTDAESFERRVRMMEEMELKEWEEREKEIQRLQDARLEILKQVVRQREEDLEKFNNERLEILWQKKLQEKEQHKDKLERKRIKSTFTHRRRMIVKLIIFPVAIRKLTDKRNKVEPKVERRDIISEYANYGSEVSRGILLWLFLTIRRSSRPRLERAFSEIKNPPLSSYKFTRLTLTTVCISLSSDIPMLRSFVSA